MFWYVTIATASKTIFIFIYFRKPVAVQSMKLRLFLYYEINSRKNKTVLIGFPVVAPEAFEDYPRAKYLGSLLFIFSAPSAHSAKTADLP